MRSVFLNFKYESLSQQNWRGRLVNLSVELELCSSSSNSNSSSGASSTSSDNDMAYNCKLLPRYLLCFRLTRKHLATGADWL